MFTLVLIPLNKICIVEWYKSKSSVCQLLVCQLNQTEAKQPLHKQNKNKKDEEKHLMNNRQEYGPWHMWCSDLIILTSLPLPRL